VDDVQSVQVLRLLLYCVNVVLDAKEQESYRVSHPGDVGPHLPDRQSIGSDARPFLRLDDGIWRLEGIELINSMLDTS
jgi:hypothetical protein